MNIDVDAERCVGSGNCAFWAPEVFDVGDAGVAVVIGDPAAHEAKVRDAAAQCPTGAIALRS